MNISSTEKACKLTVKTFEFILAKIKKGVTERQLSLEIQRFIRKNGARLAFRPIVSFGKNSAQIHHKPTEKKLKKGQIIMIDLGAKVDGYCSDMTRTLFFGKATEKQKRMYGTVLEAQKKAFSSLTRVQPLSGTKFRTSGLNPAAKEVDKIARDYIISRGYPSIPHGTGHGVGEKIHQYPSLSPKKNHKIEVGMVFTIEPGIYIGNFGGVRIEDTYVFEKNGLRQLTHSPKNLIEL